MSSSRSLAIDSSIVDSRTFAVSPDRPWVEVFQLSMPPSTASDWCSDQHRPLGNDLKLGVGDHDRDLEHAVRVRIQSGHLHIDPDEIVFAVTLAARRGLLQGL